MSTFQILIALVTILLFVALFFTTLREPLKYGVECAGFLMLVAYLVRALFVR